MNKRVTSIFFVVFYVIVFFCIGFLAKNIYWMIKNDNEIREIRKEVSMAKKRDALNQKTDEYMVWEKRKEYMDAKGDSGPPDTEDADGESIRAVGERGEILPEYLGLYEKNHDFAAWLTIDGTDISYPVMCGVDREFYLTHNFAKEYNKYGSLMLDIRCLDENFPQYIVYGHNVQKGKLFGELVNYKDIKYYKYHPDFSFDTVCQRGTYRIISVFSTEVESGTLPEYEFSAALYPDFEDYIKKMKEKSIYQTEYIPDGEGKLLALVTCDKSYDNGRFVVIAVGEPERSGEDGENEKEETPQET